jgi:hypothetical protein
MFSRVGINEKRQQIRFNNNFCNSDVGKTYLLCFRIPSECVGSFFLESLLLRISRFLSAEQRLILQAVRLHWVSDGLKMNSYKPISKLTV